MATIVKTKDLMIEVARQLFARFGFTNTTMNDIADASKRGRRTLYTYFRNKDEIYHAVIERELERLWHELELVGRLSVSPDIWLVEQARVTFDRREIRQIEAVLQEGRQAGLFFVEDVRLTAYLLQNIVKGMEVPFISGAYRSEGTVDEIRRCVRHFLLNGLMHPNRGEHI